MATRGDTMGYSGDPTAANLDRLKNVAKVKGIRWSREWPWDQATQGGAINFAAFDAEIATIQSRSMLGLFVFLGVPPWVNPNSNSGDGGRHFFPQDDLGISRTADAIHQYALRLPNNWKVQLFNETNNEPFNKHLPGGDPDLPGATPTMVGRTIAACSDAVRAANSTLEIWGPGQAALGDLNNPSDSLHCQRWYRAMLETVPELLTGHKLDRHCQHAYFWSGGDSAGTGPTADNDAFRDVGWNGWHHVLAMRELLLEKGQPGTVTVTEFGQPTGPATGAAQGTFTTHWAVEHQARELLAIAIFEELGYIPKEWGAWPYCVINTAADGALDPDDNLGIWTSTGAAKVETGGTGRAMHDALVAKALTTADTTPVTPTNPPPPPAVPVGPRTIGAHTGITTFAGGSAQAADFVAGTGCRHFRLLWGIGWDTAGLETALTDTERLGLELTIVALLDGTETTSTVLDGLERAAELEPRSIEIGWHLNDPAVNARLRDDPNTDYASRAAELTLAGADRIHATHRTCQVAAMTPAARPTGSPSHQLPQNVLRRLAIAGGAALAERRIRAGYPGTWNGGNPATTGITADPAANPLAHLDAARRAARRAGWPATLHLELGRPPATGESAATANTATNTLIPQYMTKIASLRAAGLPIVRIFWDNLTDGFATSGGLYANDGSPKAAATTFAAGLTPAWKI